MLQTEYEFELPSGYADEAGNLYRAGTMRLATALNEVEPMQDPRVRVNGAYLSILMLSRVVTRIGNVAPVPPAVIEQLFSEDFLFLQDPVFAAQQDHAQRGRNGVPGLRDALHD